MASTVLRSAGAGTKYCHPPYAPATTINVHSRRLFRRSRSSLIHPGLAGPHPRSLALRRSKTRSARAGRRRSAASFYADRFAGWDVCRGWLVLEERQNGPSHSIDHQISILDIQPSGLDRPAHADAYRPRSNLRSALPHRVTSPRHGHRHDRRLRFDRHDEAALLERQQVRRSAASAFRENQKRVARSDRRRAGLNRSERRLFVSSIDRNEAAEPEGARQNRNPIDLVLVEDVHPWMQGVKEHWRGDGALVGGA